MPPETGSTGALQPLPPIDAVPLFPHERRALLDVLASLDFEDWNRETSCPGWSLKDIAAHLLADDLGRLSGGRDGYGGHAFKPSGAGSFEADLLEFINAQNESWVAAMRRLSPALLIDLLRWSGAETQQYFESLDPNAMAHIAVSWAGEAQSANWFDLARELSERWLHQQQIREAAGIPPLYDPEIFVPALDTFVRALPHTFRDTDAPEGTTVRLTITQAGTGPGRSLRYDLVRTKDRWRIVPTMSSEPDAEAMIPADTAWRVFTKGIAKTDAMRLSTLEGDRSLAEKVFDAVSIIA
jgi:uncharacterized protein (TIGR03083 family)